MGPKKLISTILAEFGFFPSKKKKNMISLFLGNSACNFSVAIGLYNIYLQNKTKDETVKEGCLVLKIMHTPVRQTYQKKWLLGWGLLITFCKKSAFKTFLYALRVWSPLKLKIGYLSKL